MRIHVCLCAWMMAAMPALAQETEVRRGYFATAGASRLTDYGDSEASGFNFGAGVDLFATPYLRGGFQLDSHVFRRSDIAVHNTTAFLSVRALLGGGAVRPYGEAAFGFATARATDSWPIGSELSLGLEFLAGPHTAYVGYSSTAAEQPMQSLRVGVRIP